MIKTHVYSSDSLDMIQLRLRNLKNQGNPRDYEIRIDDFVVVRRTSDLSQFHLFKKSLTQSSNEVSFIIYKGKSRKYDKYVLERNVNGSPDPNMTSQEYIKHKIAEALEKDRQGAELSKLKQKTKSQKAKISMLKDRVKELESKNKGDLTALLQLASGYLSPSEETKPEEQLNGISNDDLVKMISHYRAKYGEQVFGQSLGVALQLAEHPKLIEPVKKFMNEQIEEDEKS